MFRIKKIITSIDALDIKISIKEYFEHYINSFKKVDEMYKLLQNITC